VGLDLERRKKRGKLCKRRVVASGLRPHTVGRGCYLRANMYIPYTYTSYLGHFHFFMSTLFLLASRLKRDTENSRRHVLRVVQSIYACLTYLAAEANTASRESISTSRTAYIRSCRGETGWYAAGGRVAFRGIYRVVSRFGGCGGYPPFTID
jgi:hypothetical protein